MRFPLISPFCFFHRYLFSKRASSIIRRLSFICLLGLIIAVASLIIVYSVMGGLGQSIKQGLLAEEPHLVLTFNKPFSPSFIEKKRTQITNILTRKGLHAGISSLHFFETSDLVVRTKEGIFSGTQAIGYNPDYLKSFIKNLKSQITELQSYTLNHPQEEVHAKNKASVEFEKFSLGSEHLFIVKTKDPPFKAKPQEKSIVLSAKLADELNLHRGETIELIPAENLLLPPGEPIYSERAVIKHIVYPENQSTNSRSIFYNRESFPKFSNISSYTYGLELKIKNPDQYLKYYHVLKDISSNIETWPERNSSMFFALKIEKTLMSFLLSIAGFITLLAISSLLVLLMTLKISDISILMVLGLPETKVKFLFVHIGLLLCLAGSVVGTLFALIVCVTLKYANLSFLFQFFSISGSFPVEVHFDLIVVLIILTLLFSFISCLLSVNSQFKHSPAELLKSLRP